MYVRSSGRRSIILSVQRQPDANTVEVTDQIKALIPTFEKILPVGERFFHRHGAKTVFVARFVAILRITAAWMAGVSHMRWRLFVAFDAAGGILWATVVGLIAYLFGRAAADAIQHYGLYAVGVIAALLAVAVVVMRIWRRRVFRVS